MRTCSEVCNSCLRKWDNQWLATVGVLLLLLQTGISVGWASPNIAYLLGPESPIPLTKYQASWLASYVSLGSIAGSIFGAAVSTLIGGRKTILLALLVVSVSWILIIVADSADYLYAARLLSGIADGSASACFGLYLGEIASAEKRGTLISVAGIGMSFGVVLGVTAETYIPSIKVSASIYLCLCLIDVMLVIYLADSPYYLAKKSDDDSTKKSIAFYDSHCDSDEKLADIRNYLANDAESNFKSRIKEFITPAARKCSALILLLFSLKYLCGSTVISNYSQVILIKSKSNIVKPELLVIISRVCAVACLFFARNLIDRLGRRLVLGVTSLVESLALAGLGVHFLLLDLDVDLEYIEWLPLAAFLIRASAHNVGPLVVPHIVLSEIFSDGTKRVAACVATLVGALATFITTKTYQSLVDAFGESCPFWIYAGFTLLFLPCVIFLMIETKGKTFQEIQDDLKTRADDDSEVRFKSVL